MLHVLLLIGVLLGLNGPFVFVCVKLEATMALTAGTCETEAFGVLTFSSIIITPASSLLSILLTITFLLFILLKKLIKLGVLLVVVVVVVVVVAVVELEIGVDEFEFWTPLPSDFFDLDLDDFTAMDDGDDEVVPSWFTTLKI